MIFKILVAVPVNRTRFIQDHLERCRFICAWGHHSMCSNVAGEPIVVADDPV